MVPNTQKVFSTMDIITPAEAREMRDTMHFPRQRNISETNVDRLAHEQLNDRFIPGTQIYLCLLPDGRTWIINGNHTLEAIYKSRKPQLLCITCHRVEDEAAANDLYAVFDMHKVRTWADTLRATGKHDDLPMSSQVISAVNVIVADFAQTGNWHNLTPRTEVIKLLDEYKPAVDVFVSATAGAMADIRLFLRRAPIMAVALETIRYQASAGFAFWHKVAQNDGLSRNSPESALLNWLRTEGRRNRAGHVGRTLHARAAALAWNAAWKKENRIMVQPNAMKPFRILGTPWEKGIRPRKTNVVQLAKAS